MATYESLGADPYSAIATGVTSLISSGMAVYNNIKTLEAQLKITKSETERYKIVENIMTMKLEYARITGKEYEESAGKMGDTAKNVALIGGATAIGLMALGQV